jgi:hypothetical protein
MVTDRRTALAVLSYCLVGPSLGCKERSTTGMVNQRRSDLLEFNATFTPRENDLLLSYEVSNRSTTDIYVDTVIWRELPKPEIGPDVIFVELDPWTKTVWLYKMGSGEVEANDPYHTPVRAGTTFREEVHIPFPIKPFTATGRPEPPPTARLVTYKHVYFTLAYYWRTEGMVDEAGLVDGYPVTVTRILPEGRYQEKDAWGRFETERVKLKLPVLEP